MSNDRPLGINLENYAFRWKIINCPRRTARVDVLDVTRDTFGQQIKLIACSSK